MFCRKCGAWAPRDAKYCAYCGEVFSWQGEAEKAPSVDAEAVPETDIAEKTPFLRETPEDTPVFVGEEDMLELPEYPVSEEDRPTCGRKTSEPVGVGGFLLALLLSAMPGVGFVVSLVWALGGAKNRNRRAFAVANLIIRLFWFVVFAAVAAWIFFQTPEQRETFFQSIRQWIG